ncbi:hypothetical protein WA026_017577, partial [Henosepilachna vigintioctopunctata]
MPYRGVTGSSLEYGKADWICPLAARKIALLIIRHRFGNSPRVGGLQWMPSD